MSPVVCLVWLQRVRVSLTVFVTCGLFGLVTESVCEPAPYVSDASLIRDGNKTARIVCVEGFRYPDGTYIRTIRCDDRGVWDYANISTCSGRL